jgi:chromosome segregation ATPase
MRSPDKREAQQTKRDLDEKEQQLEHFKRNVQKLSMEKNALETENLQLKQHSKQTETKLGKINEMYLPRLEEAEKLHKELSAEIRNIRQDAELLPGMFRNEAIMKKKIRDEKIFTEEKMNEALVNLDEERQRFAVLLEEKNRKDRVALQAVGARNAIERELKNALAAIEDLKKQIQSQVSHEDDMKSMVEMYKKRHDELQEHVYVQNNRINELEDQKKVLIQQLKESGNRSQAHYTYKPIKGTS